MSALLEAMYPQAVEAGIPATEFWTMTFDEIMTQVQANKNIKENELRERALFDYSQQRLSIYAFNDPKKFPKFEEAYPFIKITKTERSSEEIPDWKKDQDILLLNAEAIKATRERKNQTER